MIVTDGTRLLLGHTTRSPRWDIPKGRMEVGESFIGAAIRELSEETGLSATPQMLTSLGVHTYLRDKDLALFLWTPKTLPDPADLICAGTITLSSGARLPELDRFGLFTWDEALTLVGKNLSRVLGQIRPVILSGFRGPAETASRGRPEV